jgi:hypothetical protein
MSGVGWTCVGNVCTRSDDLNPGDSYPIITVVVNVDSDAPSSVINAVEVESETAINTDTLVTPILGLASGIYQLVPGKTNDTIYIGSGTQVVKIPDPFAITSLIGG